MPWKNNAVGRVVAALMWCSLQYVNELTQKQVFSLHCQSAVGQMVLCLCWLRSA